MKRLGLFALVSTVALVAQACSDDNFAGNGRKTTADAVRTDGKGATPQAVTGKPSSSEDRPKVGTGGGTATASGSGDDDDLAIGPNGDDETIAKCLESWGSANPFGAKPAFRTIHASVQVLGAGKGIVDDIHSDKPELVLVSAAVSVLGKTSYELLNPNGWYCIKADVNVLTGLTVNLACSAHMADSKVDVGVLSNSQPVGEVGVHVLSNVAVKRVGGTCG